MAASGDGVGWPRFNSSGGPNQTTEDVKRVFHRFRELPGEMFRCAAKHCGGTFQLTIFVTWEKLF